MKDGIHPEYKELTIVRTDGTSYTTRSTYAKSGRMQLDIDPLTHPAWTGGSAKLSDTGRVAKFNARFKGFGGGSAAPAADAEKTAEAQ
ncbi:MAG: ribosomal protein [Alphaproteobacteria bacterium]|nr:ribosomal protein [Alphaproteobacteria bacterium]